MPIPRRIDNNKLLLILMKITKLQTCVENCALFVIKTYNLTLLQRIAIITHKRDSVKQCR